MGFETRDPSRNQCMLTGTLAQQGYDWWWHSFTAQDALTGEERPFFIEYFLVNPDKGGAEPIFGQLPQNKELGVWPSYLMVKAGTWGPGKKQLHRFFGWDDVKVEWGTPYLLAADDCLACDTSIKGSVSVSAEDAQAHPEWMCDSGTMSWDLSLDKQIAFNVGYGASEPLRKAEAFEMYWHAEGMKTCVSGTVTLDGREYVVNPETSYGYADKNWGRDFTTPWVWLSSCNLTSVLTGKKLNDTVFDIGGGRPKVYAVGLPQKLLGAIWYEGQGYEFNFSKLWTLSRTSFNCYESDDYIVWHVEQDTFEARLETDIMCAKADMLLVNYEAPDGNKRHNRLWNGGNGTGILKLYKRTSKGLELIDEMLAENVGCEYGVYDDPRGSDPFA